MAFIVSANVGTLLEKATLAEMQTYLEIDNSPVTHPTTFSELTVTPGLTDVQELHAGNVEMDTAHVLGDVAIDFSLSASTLTLLNNGTVAGTLAVTGNLTTGGLLSCNSLVCTTGIAASSMDIGDVNVYGTLTAATLSLTNLVVPGTLTVQTQFVAEGPCTFEAATVHESFAFLEMDTYINSGLTTIGAFGQTGATPSDGVFFARTDTAGVYDPLYGGIFANNNGLAILGSVAVVDTLAHAGTAFYDVKVSPDGSLVSAEPPPSSWGQSDTDATNSTNAAWVGPGASVWVELPGLAITLAQDIVADDFITFDIQLSAQEVGTGNSPGIINVSIGIDGADPTAAGIDQAIVNGFDGVVPIQASASGLTLVSTQVLSVFVRVQAGSSAAFELELDGSVVNHTLNVAKQLSVSAISSTPNHPNGGLYFSGGTTTVLAAGVPLKALGATVSYGTEDDVTVSVTNRLTYTGAATLIFDVHANISVIKSSGGSTLSTISIYKGGVPITGAFVERTVASAADSGAVAICAPVELAQNEYVEIWVESDTGDDLEISAGTFMMSHT